MNMKTLHTAFLALCFASVSMVGAAMNENGKTDEDGMTTEKGQTNAMEWEKQTVTATVVEAMPDSAMLVLEGPQGKMHTIRVDEKVDLTNLNKGDKVEVELFAARGMEFREATEQDRRQPFVVEEEVEAPEGTNPKAGKLRRIKALVTITNIDRNNNTVTIQGPMGRSFVLSVTDATQLDKLQEGQEWVAIYTEGVAATVTKVQA